MSRPVDFEPAFDPNRFVGEPTDPIDERIEVGVLVVGAGPAGLACAIRFGQLLEEHPEVAERLGDVPLAVVEKGKQPGSHLLSGAVDPARCARARSSTATVGSTACRRTARSARSRSTCSPRDRALPIPTPPPMRNHGNVIVSLSQVGRWLAERAEAEGAMFLPETSAVNLLVEAGRVVGVRTGDKGRGQHGEELGNFEPGSDLVARVTVLAEGTQGHLTNVALDHFDLRGDAAPQVWELGRQGGVEGPATARPRHPHHGVAAAAAGEVPGVRRIVHLPDGRRHGGDRHGRRPRLPRSPPQPARPAPGPEDAPDDPRHPRGRRADRVGSEDHPRRGIPCAAAAAPRARPPAVWRRGRAW